MKTQLNLFGWLSAALLIGFTACDSKDPEPVNEEELITTVELTFTPATGGAAVVATWRDLDGDGANPPVVQGATLAANTTYNLTLRVLDESETPVENVTTEVLEEDYEHQFFFRATGANLTIQYADQDRNGRPIGVENRAVAGNASTGTLTVILRHKPNKAAAGVSAGDITNAGGETDVETVPAIPVTIR